MLLLISTFKYESIFVVEKQMAENARKELTTLQKKQETISIEVFASSALEFLLFYEILEHLQCHFKNNLAK